MLARLSTRENSGWSPGCKAAELPRAASALSFMSAKGSTLKPPDKGYAAPPPAEQIRAVRPLPVLRICLLWPPDIAKEHVVEQSVEILERGGELDGQVAQPNSKAISDQNIRPLSSPSRHIA